MDKTTFNGQEMGTAMADFLKSNPNIANQSNPIKPKEPQAIPVTSLTPQGSVNVPQIQGQAPIVNEITNTVDTRTATDIATAKAEAEALQSSVGSESENARKTLLDEVKTLFTQKGNAIENQAQIENDLGIKQQRDALNIVNSEIADTQIKLRAEEDRLRASGMSKGQLAIEQGNIQDTYGRRLADLAIRQSAANANIAGIREDADRKTKLLLAPIENKIQFFSTFGKENVDYLTQKDQQKLSMIVTNLENKKKEVADTEKAKNDLVMEISNNGGGTNTKLISAIQGAKTASEAVALASQSGYVGKLDRQLKQAQISKLYAEAKEKATNIGLGNLSYEDNARLNSTPQAKGINDGAKFATALQEYKDAINKYGTGEVFGQGSGALGAAYQSVVGAVKDYYTLGTLDSGVEKLISLGIPKPSVFGQKSSRVSGIDTTINNVISNIDRDVNQLATTKYANSVEGLTLLNVGLSLKQKRDLEKATNEQFLKSLPATMKESTPATDNASFFNR